MVALREKGLLSTEEIDAALRAAEEQAAADPGRATQLSPANTEAINFPLRILRLANRASSRGERRSFAELAAEIGRTKPER
jgi:hypothetical protein